MALFGPLCPLVAVPLAFRQPAIGGAQMPIRAAPGWIQGLARLGSDGVGGSFRSAILGAANPFPRQLALGAALLGLVTIGLGALFARRPTTA